MDKNWILTERLESLDERIGVLEQQLEHGESPEFSALLAEGAAILNGLLTAYAEHAGKVTPVTDDLLELFKAFVKGDPSLNAVRDNIRELVYYQNCLAMDRSDALPQAPEKMVVHTVRHVYFYLRSRCEQEHRLD